ncbi:uncharacterized protein LOC142768308 [Rhipicephalus microplus]|uniref:uncharacterized protein LOC142768308 n=1 Tax=Rhipicephalus microplus TaxID=6941 RepID=UPI003F6BC4D1
MVKHHRDHDNEGKEQKGVKCTDKRRKKSRDAAKTSPASPPNASSAVCQPSNQKVAGTDKPLTGRKQSSQGTQKEDKTPKVNEKSAQKPDTADTLRKRSGPVNRKGEPSKQASPKNVFSSQTALKPCSSTADRSPCSAFYLVGCWIPVTIVCALGLAVYIVVHMLIHHTSMAAKFVWNPSTAELQKLCSTATCRRAMGAMTEYMEEVDPCLDFERHVCGRWFRHRSRRESYEQEAVDLFLTRIHQALENKTQQPAAHGIVSREYNIAKLYNSCLNFVVQDQKTKFVEVLQAMGISAEMQQLVRSSEDLFRFIVGTSLSTGLPSVVRITLRSGFLSPSVFVPVIDMGQTLRASLHYVDVPPYLQEAIGDLQVPDGAGVIEAATKIDEAVETWRVQADRSEAFAIVRLGQLGEVVVGASWTEALNTGLPRGNTTPQFTANDTAKIRAREMIHGALTVLLLGRESIQHVRFYVVLLFLAQVMKYRYLLERPLERTLKDHAWCLHETAVLSSTFFPTWVTKTLVAPDAIQDLGRMMEGLREAMVREPDTLPELNISASEATKWTVYVIGSEGSLNTGFSTSSPAAAPTLYGDRFLLNVARASKDNVFPTVFQRESSTSTGSEGNTDMDAGTLAALQIEGTISYDAHTRQLLVPAVWLSDLMFVRDGSFPVLDVAALGVRLLAVWIRAQLAGRPQVLENLKSTAECPGHEFETPLDEDNPDQVVREVASTEWALRIAFQASRSRERLAADVLRDRVFFWRFCQTHCGDVVGRDACEFAVHLAGGFRDAFECREFVPPHCWA